MAEENKVTAEAENTTTVDTTASKPEVKEDFAAENARLKAEIEKLRQATNNASSDAARYKKQLQERMSEQEKAEAERAERDAQREARIAELEKRERIANYRSAFMGGGYDETTASELAEMLPDGVSDEFFNKTKAFLDSYAKNIEARALNKQPDLSAGMPLTAQDAKAAEEAKLRKYFGLA